MNNNGKNRKLLWAAGALLVFLYFAPAALQSFRRGRPRASRALQGAARAWTPARERARLELQGGRARGKGGSMGLQKKSGGCFHTRRSKASTISWLATYHHHLHFGHALTGHADRRSRSP